MGISSSIGIGAKKLTQTSVEQAVLRNIQALELELETEKDPKRMEEITDQINDLKASIALAGANYSFLLGEQKEFQKEKQIERLEEEIGESSAKFRLYELLLYKYADIINEFEKKTVGEIKAMVNADDLTVQSIVQDFRKENYVFEKDYFESAKKAFEFISNEITFVKADLDVNFWLSPKEIMNKKVGDDEDLAVFLCSVLSALGDKKAEVVIAELENLTTRAFVVTEMRSKFFILDAAQKKPFEEFSGAKTEVLAKYSFSGAKIKRFLYKFNFEKYEQFV
ncbi:MAG: hypothetical protein HYW50_02600 [Candidatus Diapherotrites archaeon]|nr:hypothetical protein [Candidatus Diapherotrites archaeon]